MNKMKVNALSLDELRQKSREPKYTHIWVKIFHQNPDYTYVVAAILDFREPENEFVAIWNAEPNESSWLWERTYGTEWLAYLEEPPEEDDYDPEVPPGASERSVVSKMLVNNKALYKKLESTIQNIHFEIHAIYEPDGSEGFGDCYCAAVDLFKQGTTYRVYFKTNDTGNIEVEHLERWFFG